MNFPAFYAAEESLERLQWTCLNPARMDIEDAYIDPPMEIYARRDINAILSLKTMEREGAKIAIHLLEGWHKSVGARAEHAIAEWLDIERIYL